MSRETLHELVDRVDEDTAEELLEYAEWLLQEQAKVSVAKARVAWDEAD